MFKSLKKALSPGCFMLAMLVAVVLMPGFTVWAEGATGTTYYVTQSGAGDGSSWDNALSGGQLAEKLSNATAGDVFYVAKGTYTPTSSAERTATFHLKKGVKIYGGFAGDEVGSGEELLTKRDMTTNKTILSGDIGVVGNAGDNCYHVVTGGASATS